MRFDQLKRILIEKQNFSLKNLKDFSKFQKEELTAEQLILFVYCRFPLRFGDRLTWNFIHFLNYSKLCEFNLNWLPLIVSIIEDGHWWWTIMVLHQLSGCPVLSSNGIHWMWTKLVHCKLVQWSSSMPYIILMIMMIMIVQLFPFPNWRREQIDFAKQ